MKKTVTENVVYEFTQADIVAALELKYSVPLKGLSFSWPYTGWSCTDHVLKLSSAGIVDHEPKAPEPKQKFDGIY